MSVMRKASLFIFIAVWLVWLALFAWLVLTLPAQAHQVAAMQYPPRCCGGASTTGDCAPLVGIGVVKRHADGWFIPLTGETIPFDQAEPSTDLQFHRCVFQGGAQKGKTRCLFAPETGS